MNLWWTNQQAGFVGAIVGTSIGLLGAVLGTVAGICAPRGRCKGIVYAMTALLTLIGVGGLLGGIAALLMHQPYHVWYVLLLCGVTCLPLGVMSAVVVRNRYRQADTRRLEAEQLRRS